MKNKNISYGNNSTNIGQAENVEIKYTNQEPTVINYSKKNLKDVAISPKKLTLSGVFSFGGLIITYVSLIVKYPITELSSLISVMPFVMMLSVSILIIGLTLRNRRFIPFLSIYSLESNEKKISLKRTKAKCPVCNSNMRIFKNENGVFISCKRNPEQHLYAYDYTTFVDNE